MDWRILKTKFGSLEELRESNVQAQFEENGCLLVENALSADFTDALRREVDILKAKSDEKKGEILNTDGSVRIRQLLRSSLFELLLHQKDLINTIEFLGGFRPVLSSYTSNTVLPGAPGMGRHRDYPYFALPDYLDYRAFPPMAIQVLWALDHFAQNNGPTLVAPASHRYDLNLSQEEFEKCSSPLIMPAGSAFIFHGAMLHGVAPNTSQFSRTSVIAAFTPYWVRPMHREFGESEEFRNSDIGKSLLGLDFRARVRADLQKIGYGVAKPEQR